MARKKKTISLQGYAYEITDVEVENHQASGETVTAVAIDISKDGEVIATRRLGFPATATKDEITVELTKVVQSIANDHRVAAESAQVEVQTQQANDLKQCMLGQKVEVETNATDNEEPV